MPNPSGESFPVIYLTGAPAAGKSTLVNKLTDLVPNLLIFHYGEELTKYLNLKNRSAISQEELRSESALIASEDDIETLDGILLQFVSANRAIQPILIDTHAVTKEGYGFRVSPFSMGRVKQLNPTRIVVLYTSPEVTIDRIAAHPGGRPMVSPFEAGFHTGMQASVAISYAIGLGLPVHFLDSSAEVETLATWMQRKISAT